MKRPALVYRPLKKEKNESLKIAVLDLETRSLGKNEGQIEVRHAGYYDGVTVSFFRDVSGLLDHIFVRDNRGVKIYAHNGGKFDFLPIIEECSKRKLTYKITQIAGRVAQLKVTVSGNSQIVFRDSICILPDKLSNLTTTFDVEHKKLEHTIDFEKEEFDPKNRKHLLYLAHDLKGTYEVITKFFTSEKVRDVKPRLTIASTALAVHRTMLKASVRTTHQGVQNFCRDGYYGGRVEVFNHEGFNLNCYDFNSIYPFCMKTFPIPLEYIGSAQNHQQFGFHKVTVKSPDLYIPVLPLKFEGKLIFPNGEFTGVFFSEELKLAEKHGYKITKYFYGERFSECHDFFTEYVDFFYALRKLHKGKSLDYIAKLFLNALYGKFGQREQFQTLRTFVKDNKNVFSMFGNEEIFNKFGLIVEKTRQRSPHMMVHIAAAITSYAKIHLYNEGLLKSEDLNYCDTDSLYTPDFFNSSSDLGSLKKEYPEKSIDYGFFRTAKMYALKFNTGEIDYKCKGFPQSFLKTVALNDFKTGNLELERLKVYGLKSAIKSTNNAFVEGFYKKSINQSYNKRMTMSDFTTRPWHLKNGVLT